MGLMYQVIARKDDGSFDVVREDGKKITNRKRVTHAERVARCLEMGVPYQDEVTQVLGNWADVKVEHKPDFRRSYCVVDNYGVVVASFRHEYIARWWVRDYKARRQLVRESKRKEREQIEQEAEF